MYVKIFGTIFQTIPFFVIVWNVTLIKKETVPFDNNIRVYIFFLVIFFDILFFLVRLIYFISFIDIWLKIKNKRERETTDNVLDFKFDNGQIYALCDLAIFKL